MKLTEQQNLHPTNQHTVESVVDEGEELSFNVKSTDIFFAFCHGTFTTTAVLLYALKRKYSHFIFSYISCAPGGVMHGYSVIMEMNFLYLEREVIQFCE